MTHSHRSTPIPHESRYPLQAVKEFKGGEGKLPTGIVATALNELVEVTRTESEAMFGESADNITAIAVAFDLISPAK